MIKIQNEYGMIKVSNKYITNLVKNTVLSCFGVADISTEHHKFNILDYALKSQINKKGIQIIFADGNLNINIYVLLKYGVNVKAVSNSIANKTSYAIEQATGIIANNVNVYVDGLVY